MILLQEESILYYKLLFGIQYFIFKNINNNTKISSIKGYSALPRKTKIKVRDLLWTNNKWIDKYININPDKFPEEELEIIDKWKSRIKGNFFIERLLKKYAIFISSESKVYGVIGLIEEIDEIIDINQIPVYVETVLLPFKNKIIYDGIISKHEISFGRGIREMFKSTYNKAKKENQIIISM